MDCNLKTKKNIDYIYNWIDGKLDQGTTHKFIEKFNPHDGTLLSLVQNSTKKNINQAINVADQGFKVWSNYTPIQRGNILYQASLLMRNNVNDLAKCIATETGKSLKNSIPEVNASILQAEYFAGEGMRLFGKSFTSGMLGKYTYSIRQPHGIAALIVPANTPLANIAWKIFPALICGNSVILKSSEDSPAIANMIARILKESGLPDGVFNVVHGRGDVSGSLLVSDNRIPLISFTGSTTVGKKIAEIASNRLARVSLELGGKNPLVICDDADIENAVKWSILSAFSNAGQRCAAASRILIFKNIYNQFKEKLLIATKNLKLGITDECDLGPVINLNQKKNILNSIKEAELEGGKILCGGNIPKQKQLNKGYYISPTIIENLKRDSDYNRNELFGPVVALFPVDNLNDALELSNKSEFGLTSAIHTKSIDKAFWYANRIRSGTVNINIGTYGSEPHIPFGGFGISGNGTREPGAEAIDVYSELKNISYLIRDNLL